MAGRRFGTTPGRRLAFAALVAVATLGSSAASAAADQQIVTATVYSASGTQQESLTLQALAASSNQCPAYTGTLPVQHGQNGQTTTPNFTGGEVWALSTILSCLQPAVPLGAVKGVTIIQADGTPEASSGSQLTAADLGGGPGFADPSEVPVIGNQGTTSAESIQYDRPWRGGDDNNFDDQVTPTTGSPVAIEVFEGPLLTVTPHASATKVPAGGSVSFSATFEPSGVSGVTYNWSFDGGATNSTASAPTVTFTAGGTYNVTVQVTDDEGGGGAATIPITVTSSIPPASGSNNNGPTNSGGTGGQVPRKHPSGNGGQGNNGNRGGGSNGGRHSGSPTSGGHSGTTPNGSGGHGGATPAASAGHGGATPAASGRSGTTAPAPGSSAPAPGSPPAMTSPPVKTHAAAPRHRAHHQPSHLKAPAAPGAQGPLVAGRLVSDVTPVPARASPLVHAEVSLTATSAAARSSAEGSPVAPVVAGLAVLTLLGLGARRELRGRRSWWSLRSGS